MKKSVFTITYKNKYTYLSFQNTDGIDTECTENAIL